MPIIDANIKYWTREKTRLSFCINSMRGVVNTVKVASAMMDMARKASNLAHQRNSIEEEVIEDSVSDDGNEDNETKIEGAGNSSEVNIDGDNEIDDLAIKAARISQTRSSKVEVGGDSADSDDESDKDDTNIERENDTDDGSGDDGAKKEEGNTIEEETHASDSAAR